jgi:hypothetical protein
MLSGAILWENSSGRDQPGIQLLPFLHVIRAPGGIGALRVMTSASPVPFAVVAQENVHAKTLFEPEFEFVYPVGTASLFHVA